MAHCALPARYQREVTIILVDQSDDGEWWVHDPHGLGVRCLDRSQAVRLARIKCEFHPGSVVVAMPPVCTGARREASAARAAHRGQHVHVAGVDRGVVVAWSGLQRSV